MRRSSALALPLLAALALAGCAAGLPLQPTVMAPAAGLAAQGEADLVVRTFVETPEGGLAEVGGAVCDVRSLLFATRLTTPARLVVPSFGPQSVALDIACRAGARTGAVRRAAVARWTPAPGGWGWGWSADAYPGVSVGSWGWGGGWNGGWGASGYPEFVYPNVSVTLE